MDSREDWRRRNRRKKIFLYGIFLFILVISVVIAGKVFLGSGEETAAADFVATRPSMLTQKNTTSEPKSEKTRPGMEKGVIVVDAGHGGFDVGTRGRRTGVYEMDLNLAIAKELEKELRQAGFRVIMTRETPDAIAETKEQDMQKRSDIIAEKEVDLMVSIHQNWFQSEDASGPQVFYMPGSTQGAILANRIQTVLVRQLEVQRPRTEKAEDYRLLKAGSAPAVIVECGFLSNPQDESNLSDAAYQKKVAKAVAEGVELYWNNR